MTRPDEPVVIVGGNNQIASLINKLVDIAYGTPAGVPPQRILVLMGANRNALKADDSYPLNGKSPDQFHPLRAAKPPPGFPTLGEYVREMLEDDPSLESALRSPTHGQIAEYMEFVLDLAVMTVGDKALLETSSKVVQSIDQETRSGPGTIHFEDGTTLSAREIITD